jgi:hypothetical protein
MKNIHLIPTSQPSRLVKFFTNKFHLCKEILPIQDEEQYHHIYITSDEEIKVNDAVIDLETNDIFISKGKMLCNDFIKKIILTDNADLIKDGIQPIDDTFLEWFVKNPSCEEVDVTRNLADEGIKGITYYGKYFIIIPQEEPKQEPIKEPDYNKIIEQSLVELRKQPMSFVPDKIMYSEEEVLEILDKFLESMLRNERTGLTEKWFEKHKKK